MLGLFGVEAAHAGWHDATLKDLTSQESQRPGLRLYEREQFPSSLLVYVSRLRAADFPLTWSVRWGHRTLPTRREFPCIVFLLRVPLARMVKLWTATSDTILYFFLYFLSVLSWPFHCWDAGHFECVESQWEVPECCLEVQGPVNGGVSVHMRAQVVSLFLCVCVGGLRSFLYFRKHFLSVIISATYLNIIKVLPSVLHSIESQVRFKFKYKRTEPRINEEGNIVFKWFLASIYYKSSHTSFLAKGNICFHIFSLLILWNQKAETETWSQL